MGFSQDETLLNSINLDSINQYRQFIEQIKPILLQESGYQEVAGTKSSGYSTGKEVFNTVRATGFYDGKINRENAARQLGVSQGEFDQLSKLGQEYYNLEQRPVDATMASDPKNRNYALAKETIDRMTEINKQVSEFQIGTKNLQKTAAQLEREAKLKELEAQQLEITKAQAERQRKALAGEIGPSDILTKGIQDEFNTFKEAQARAGNVILGDDPFTAVGKGDAAIKSLASFTDNAKAAIQRETQSIIQGETPLYYGGLGLAQGVRTGVPQIPYGGLSQLSLSGMQPFQFNRQMDYNWAALNQNSNTRSGKSGLLGGLAGAGIGGLLGGPMGASVGFNIGQGTGQAFF